MAPLARTMSRVQWVRIVLATGLLALTTVAITWPLFRHPASTVLDTESLYGPASVLVQRDINLNIWTLAWDSHALVTDPLHLFHANAFYPARYTLALFDHLLGIVPLFAPVYWATANPVLAHQVALLLSFVLAGLGMTAYVLYWTEDEMAALAAGFLYAFAPFRLWQLGNLQVISVQYLPLVALAIDASLDGRWGCRAPLLLTGALVLSAFSSYYVGYPAFLVAGVYTTMGLLARGRAGLGRLGPIGTALTVAALATAVVSVPYVLLQRSGVLPDYEKSNFTSLAFLTMLRFGLSGVLRFYVVPSKESIPVFLTYTAMTLGMTGVLVHRRHPRGALVMVGAVGIVLALGPDLLLPGIRPIPLPYRLLAAVVPGFSALRVPQRFGVLAALALGSLSGLGLAAARRWLGTGRRVAAALPVLAIAAVLAETRPGGLRGYPLPVGPNVPAAYRWLAEHGNAAPLLELPLRRANLYGESLSMYYSTFHWLPVVNGYTSYPPRPYVGVAEAAAGLPRPDALDAILRQVPLRWILLHRDAVAAGTTPAWEATLRQALTPVADFGETILFEVPADRRPGGVS
ncbi:MAG: hypothetical protein DMD97_04605 [Candidatus Rokuibacteriota bacterium]|nr:MAG: hypothetical protein DMD97_04605 [Candidatus Rokubacteria bacterium]